MQSSFSLHFLEVSRNFLELSSLHFLEVDSWRCSVKKVYLQTSQNLQENSCARVFFFNKSVRGLQIY